MEKNLPELSERGRKQQVKVGNRYGMEGGKILHNIQEASLSTVLYKGKHASLFLVGILNLPVHNKYCSHLFPH